jgi:hypothetical protein
MKCLQATSFALLVCFLSSGCGPGKAVAVVAAGETIQQSGKWVDEIVAQFVAWLEDEHGLTIERPTVKVTSLAVRQQKDSFTYLGDFRLIVTYRKTEFTSAPKDIPCDADGIPTAEGNQRIRGAVEEIKSRIKDL